MLEEFIFGIYGLKEMSKLILIGERALVFFSVRNAFKSNLHNNFSRKMQEAVQGSSART